MKKLFFTLCLVLLASPAWAAVTYDTSTVDATMTPAGTSFTTSITVGSGSNVAVFVCVSANAVNTDNVTDVDVDGVQGTEVVADVTSATLQSHLSMWYAVLGTTSGAKTVAVTSTGGGNKWKVHMYSFFGVDQASPIGTPATASSTGATSTTTAAVSSAVSGMVLGCLANNTNSSAYNVGGGHTQRIEELTDIDSTDDHGATAPGAASVTMSYSWTTSDDYAHIVVPINGASTRRAVPPIIFQ